MNECQSIFKFFPKERGGGGREVGGGEGEGKVYFFFSVQRGVVLSAQRLQ